MNIMARDKVVYVGHAVAAVAAKDRNTGLEALKRITFLSDIIFVCPSTVEYVIKVFFIYY